MCPNILHDKNDFLEMTKLNQSEIDCFGTQFKGGLLFICEIKKYYRSMNG